MKTNSRHSIENYVFVFLTLIIVAFFNPFNVFDNQEVKLMRLIGICGCLAWTFLKSIGHLHYPKYSYFLMYLGFVMALISATFFHRQGLILNIISISSFFIPWLSFYLFLRLRPNKSFVIKTLFVFSCISIVIYIINFTTFPNVIFGGIKDETGDVSRGFLRIAVPMLDVIVLCLFYLINKITIERKISLGLILTIILFYVMVIVSLTRQTIFLTTVFGCLLFLANQPLVKKIASLIVIFILFFYVIPETDLYKQLEQATEREMTKYNGLENNVRVKAWEFYLIENQKNCITPIVGNGVPALHKSAWGKEEDLKTDIKKGGNGCYVGDVGWAGFFWYFGLIGTIGLLGLFVSGILKKKPKEDKYLAYWLILTALTSVSSAPILYSNQIYTICIVLYLIYGKNSNNNLRVQQF